MLLAAYFLNAGIVIKINLSIGKKSQPETCPNFGICDFSISTNYRDGFINGTLDVNTVDRSMVLSIYEKDILKVQPDKLVFLKGRNSVTLSEDFTLPSEFNRAANISRPMVFKKGEYLLTYKNGMYIIEFPL